MKKLLDLRVNLWIELFQVIDLINIGDYLFNLLKSYLLFVDDLWKRIKIIHNQT